MRFSSYSLIKRLILIVLGKRSFLLQHRRYNHRLYFLGTSHLLKISYCFLACVDLGHCQRSTFLNKNFRIFIIKDLIEFLFIPFNIIIVVFHPDLFMNILTFVTQHRIILSTRMVVHKWNFTRRINNHRPFEIIFVSCEDIQLIIELSLYFLESFNLMKIPYVIIIRQIFLVKFNYKVSF